jgi:hypothetical protein
MSTGETTKGIRDTIDDMATRKTTDGIKVGDSIDDIATIVFRFIIEYSSSLMDFGP